MAKLGWDAFVKKHGSGHCLTTGTNRSVFPQPPNLAPNGQKWPTLSAMIGAIVALIAKSDWAMRSQTETAKSTSTDPRTKRKKTKVQKIVLTHMIFESDVDTVAVAKAFGTKTDQTTAIQATIPCKTQHRLPPFEGQAYAAAAKRLGYIK